MLNSRRGWQDKYSGRMRLIWNRDSLEETVGEGRAFVGIQGGKAGLVRTDASSVWLGKVTPTGGSALPNPQGEPRAGRGLPWAIGASSTGAHLGQSGLEEGNFLGG